MSSKMKFHNYEDIYVIVNKTCSGERDKHVGLSMGSMMRA